jgi:hypothetical protein
MSEPTEHDYEIAREITNVIAKQKEIATALADEREAGHERAREAAIALVEHEVEISHASHDKATLGGIITEHLRIELQVFEKPEPPPSEGT